MKRKKTIIILIFTAIVAITAVYFFVFFLKILDSKNQNITVSLAALQEKLMEKENALLFADKVNEIKSVQETINSHFVDSNKIDTFVSSLEAMGSTIGSNVSVKSIEVPKEPKDTISFELSITGTFDHIMKTVTFLENIPYQVNITKVYLNKNLKQTIDIKQPVGKVIINDKVSGLSTWQADVSFNILSIN